jgi:hypothetical protein
VVLGRCVRCRPICIWRRSRLLREDIPGRGQWRTTQRRGGYPWRPHWGGRRGAALAVYLTIDGQRRDEAQKVEAALRMEVAEFGRLAPLPLYLLSQRVIAEHAKIPARDLPVLVAMPEAIVYRETADRISRLPCTLRLAQLSPHALRTARRTTILIAWNCVISDISWQSPRKGIFLARQYELG